MRTAILGAALLVVGFVAIALGILPIAEALAVASRVWPILFFVVAITVVTELAAEAGLFRVIAERTARWGRGRAWLLWLLVLALAVVGTIFLSLDTTAVLLTPVVVILARHVGLSPLPFALTTVWMANTASLLLPVSNLTNLLAEHELRGVGPLQFAALMVVPAAISIVIPSAILFIVYRRDLLMRYEPDATTVGDDRVLLVASGVIVGALIPLLVSGLPVWIPRGRRRTRARRLFSRASPFDVACWPVPLAACAVGVWPFSRGGGRALDGARHSARDGFGFGSRSTQPAPAFGCWHPRRQRDQ